MRLIRSSAGPLVPVPRRELVRRVTGTPAEVAATITTIRDSGRLVAMGPAHLIPDGRVWVTVRFLDRPTQLPRRRMPVVLIMSAVAAVAAVAWLAAQLVNALVAALPLMLGGLVLLTLVWLALRRSGVCCPGLHCPGCKH